MDPGGTITCNELELALITGALTEPKKTMLSDGLELKLEPLIKMISPIPPEIGAKVFIAGTLELVIKGYK